MALPVVPPSAEFRLPVLALPTLMGWVWRGSHRGVDTPYPASTPTGLEDPVLPNVWLWEKPVCVCALTVCVCVLAPELTPPPWPAPAPFRKRPALSASSTHPDTFSAAHPRMPVGYAACAPSLDTQITVRVGGRLPALAVPGELDPELVAARLPVALGRACECGWLAWLIPALLYRALIVLELLVPVFPPTEWVCAPIECTWPGVVCEWLAFPPVALGTPVVLVPRGYRSSSAVTRVQPEGIEATDPGHAKMRSAGMVLGSSTKVDTYPQYLTRYVMSQEAVSWHG